MAKQFNVRAGNARHTLRPPVAFDTGNFVAATHAVASLVVVADAARPINVYQVMCGYSATPAAGATLTILDGATTVFQMPIVSAGPFVFSFDPPQSGTPGSSLTVTLSDGGAAVLGYVFVNCLTLT